MSTRTTTRGEIVTLMHGAGGRAMRRLIEETLTAGFGENGAAVGLAAMDDGAAFRIGPNRWLVLTTDSHVIHPIEFPGGDIGRLSIAGTVNDLAMMGATEPLGLTSAVILEEGFATETLERIQASMAATCGEAGATVVTGDTKVMGRGELDGMVINTTGVALVERVVTDAGLAVGDRILVTGTIGDHGVALMATRHDLDLEGDLRSDVAPINGLIRVAIEAAVEAVGPDGDGIAAMKDPTRGGLASALHEMAEKAGVGIAIDGPSIPVSPAVASAAEILGLDPFHIANEGKAVLGVKSGAADAVLGALRSHPLGADAAIVGEVTAEQVGRVVLDTGFGRRLVTEPEGEPLPRIC
ncbi:MAG: hydrogenase expression/formation protein HypE [Gemmatimonadota bacterium]|nr:hydrogenase expression/formation protein HypE [Gemmatimonadota bacterium]